MRKLFLRDVGSAFSRYLRYPLLVSRRSFSRYGSWISMTRLEALLVCLFLAANILVIFIPFRNLGWRKIEQRCAFVAAVNVIPLSIGGRPLMRTLNISNASYTVFHHWVGRMAVFQAIVHACIVLAHRPRPGVLVTSGWMVSYAQRLADCRLQVIRYSLHLVLSQLSLCSFAGTCWAGSSCRVTEPWRRPEWLRCSGMFHTSPG